MGNSICLAIRPGGIKSEPAYPNDFTSVKYP